MWIEARAEGTAPTVVTVSGIDGQDGPSPSDIDPAAFRLVWIDGWIVQPEYVGSADSFQVDSDVLLDDALTWEGEWLGAFRGSDGSVVLATDGRGFGQLFYAVVPDAAAPDLRLLVAGLSFRGVSIALRNRGRRQRLRTELALPTLSSHHYLFAGRWSSETLASDIQVVPHDAFLHVSAAGVVQVTRPRREYVSTQGALESAVEWASGCLVRMVGSGMPVSLNLSGGRDSRMVLALIVANGLQHQVSIRTESPPRTGDASQVRLELDAALAAKMVAYFGLTWESFPPSQRRSLSLEESIEQWQSFRSNASYDFTEWRIGNLERQAIISLNGLGGELLRSHNGSGIRASNPAWWNAAGQQADTVRADLRSLFGVICKVTEPQAVDLYRAATEAFVRSYDLGAPGSVLSQIDMGYHEYRNRTFSGVARFGALSRRYGVSPIASQGFVDYARMVEHENRSYADLGGAIFDIIEHLEPALNALPFDSKQWPREFVTKGSSKVWDAIDSAQADRVWRSRPTGSPEPVVGPTVSVERSAGERLDRIERTTGRLLDAGMPEIVVRLAASLALKDVKHERRVLIMFESLLDAIEPTMVSGHSEVPLTVPRTPARRAVPAFREAFDALDLRDVSATAERDEAARSITVTVAGMRTGCEVACYAYFDDEARRTRWYQDSPAFSFDLDGRSPQTMRFMVFVRWKHRPSASRVISFRYA